jgi:hypothetical protein
MNIEKVIIAKAFKPLKKDPPMICSKEKTIGFDTFKRCLFMFKDSRRQAQDYIREVLPTMLMAENAEKTSMNLYNGLDGSYLEFDFTTNLLYLCSIKKT